MPSGSDLFITLCDNLAVKSPLIFALNLKPNFSNRAVNKSNTQQSGYLSLSGGHELPGTETMSGPALSPRTQA